MFIQASSPRPSPPEEEREIRSRSGFNLLELLVVLAVLSLLLVTLAPTLAKTGLSSKSFSMPQ